MTNQLMDNFYVAYFLEFCLKSVLFRYLVCSLQNQAIDQLTLGDRPVDPDRLVGHLCSI